MAVTVAINGFGRIGRNVLRAIIEAGRTDIEVAAINDLGPVETNAHLLKYDSVHGRFPASVSVAGNTIDVGRGPIEVTAIRNPADLPWSHIDIVLECTGIFTSKEACAAHLENGSKRVLISAPGKDADQTIVYGVNHNVLSSSDVVVSNASCTTNCLAPVAKVLNDEIGIIKGFMTTVHSYTGDQRLLDASHRDVRRARAAAMNIVPTSTGAAKAVALVLPNLKGKLNGVALRVPTPNVSMVDFVVQVEKPTIAEELNQAFKNAAEGELKGFLGYTDLPLVSSDFKGSDTSSVVDASLTMVMGGDMVKVMAWYDNEWGYSQRVVDLAELVAQKWNN